MLCPAEMLYHLHAGGNHCPAVQLLTSCQVQAKQQRKRSDLIGLQKYFGIHVDHPFINALALFWSWVFSCRKHRFSREKFTGSSSSPFQECPGEGLLQCTHSTEMTLCLNSVIWDGLKDCFKPSTILKDKTVSSTEVYYKETFWIVLGDWRTNWVLHQFYESCMSDNCSNC